MILRVYTPREHTRMAKRKERERETDRQTCGPIGVVLHYDECPLHDYVPLADCVTR